MSPRCPPDVHAMAEALVLAEQARGTTWPNPNVGCVILRDGSIVGRGWTGPGGRPHAEATALAEAGEAATGATVYVTLEPCAHVSERGPACTDLLLAARPERVVVALADPDPRTAGRGIDRLRAAGIAVEVGTLAQDAEHVMAGWLSRQRAGRPFVTLKLAMSLDGRIAMADGSSRWITGPAARDHAHLERARSDAVLVGGGTLRSDAPRLDVRLPGLEGRSPARLVLSRGEAPEGWTAIRAPEEIAGLSADWLLVEGGAGAAAAFLRAGLVDRLTIYRAPILIGEGRSAVGDLGLGSLAEAHGRWRPVSSAMIGPDRLDIYQPVRDS